MKMSLFLDCWPVTSPLFNVFLLFSLFPLQSAFVLEGSSSSYAQFPSWNPDIHSKISLEFRTDSPNCLVWYSEHPNCHFIEMKLVGGALQVRLDLGGGVGALTLDTAPLSNSLWHRVDLVTGSGGNVSLSVDNLKSDTIQCLNWEQSGSRAYPSSSSTSSQSQFVYIGGLPSWYNSKLKVRSKFANIEPLISTTHKTFKNLKSNHQSLRNN